MRYAIDLFCGAGGMSEGIIQAGFHILFSSDLNEQVQKTYMNRHKQLGYIQGENTFYHRCDIKDLTGEFIFNSIKSLKMFDNRLIPEIDAIFGGPPCQGFSRAGLRRKDDPRNLLFREYLRIISEVKPKYIVVENVLGFLDMQFNGFVGLSSKTYNDGTTTPEILKSELFSLNYNVDMKVLDASDFGVPQKRKRVIFIAGKRDLLLPHFPTPLNINKITIDEAIGDLNGNIKLSDYQKQSINGRTPNIITNTSLPRLEILNNEPSIHSDIIAERFSLYNEGESTLNLRNRMLNKGIDLSEKKSLINLCSNFLNISEETVIDYYKTNPTKEMIDILLTKKNIRIRLDRYKPSNTITTLPDDYISPYDDRALTVRECARLQSFDDSFEFLGKRTTGGKLRRIEIPQLSQVGNAVPPLLAKAIALEIIKIL